MESTEYLNQLRTLHRIFRLSDDAFIFASAKDEKLIDQINQNLIELSAQNQKIILQVDSAKDFNIPFFTSLEKDIAKKGKVDGLIVNSLQRAFQHNSQILLEINVQRESLSALGIPILFWLSPDMIFDVIRLAKDIYSQRAISLIDFKDVKAEEIGTLFARDANESGSTPEKINPGEQISIQVLNRSFTNSTDLLAISNKIAWLEEQLSIRESKGPISKADLKSLVAPLLDNYQKLPGRRQNIISILDKYASNLEEFGFDVILGNAWTVLEEWEKAEAFYLRALNQKETWDKTLPPALIEGTLHFELGLIYSNKKQHKKAIIEFKLAIQQFETLGDDLWVKWEKLGTSTANLGLMSLENNLPEDAENWFQKALIYLRPENPQFQSKLLPFYANVLILLGTYFVIQNQLEKGENLLNESIEIFKKLNEENPELYLIELSDALNNLAIVFSQTKRGELSYEMHKESLKIRRAIKAKNPKYWKILSEGLNNLAATCLETGRTEEAKKYLEEALELYRSQLDDQTGVYKSGLCSLLLNLGTLYNKTYQNDKVIEALIEAEVLARSLAISAPELYKSNLADILGNLGNFFAEQGQIALAETKYKEAIHIYKELVLTNKDAFSVSLGRCASNLALLYQQTQQDQKALAYNQITLQTLKPYKDVNFEARSLYELSLKRLRRLGYMQEVREWEV